MTISKLLSRSLRLTAPWSLHRSRRQAIVLSLLGAAWLCFCGGAVAQTTRPQAVTVSGPFEQSVIKRNVGPAAGGAKGANSAVQNKWDLAKVPLALGGVLLLIFVLRWGGRAMLRTAGKQRTSSAIQVLSRSTVSPRQQLMLVRVGRRLVLVGNSGSEMTPLCQIDDPDEVAEVLRQLSQDNGGKSFRTMVGRAGKQYEPATPPASGPEEEETNETETASNEVDPSTQATREELSGLMDRVRRISQQFQKS